MPLRGRGRNYSRTRGVLEAVLSRAFAGDWPARLPIARAARVQAREHHVAVAALSGKPLRVGFAADLHAGPTTPQETLERAFAHLRRFTPDVLLLGGDFVLFDAAHAARLVPLLRAVEAPLGRFAVLGNHDLWADDRRITAALESAGVRVLANEVVRLRGRRDGVTVGALDDAWAGSPDYDRAFAGAGPVHLLLMHGPDHAPHLDGRRFAAGFCGHTHGGHIALPGGRPILVPTPWSRRYPHGRFELKGGPLLVSRGVGNVEVPFRAFAPPDVLCVTLARPG